MGLRSWLALSTIAAMIPLCPKCRHYRAPSAIQPFDATRGKSAGEARALGLWKDELKKRQSEEDRRFVDGDDFHFEPEFYEWCVENVPNDKQLAALTEWLQQGNRAALEEAWKAGLRFTIDGARGKVSPVYELCRRKNGKTDCRSFVANDPEET